MASFAAFALASALALAGAAFAGPLELLAASAMVEGVGPEISRGNPWQMVGTYAKMMENDGKLWENDGK